MNRQRRAVAVTMAAVGLSMFAGAAWAHADPSDVPNTRDERFTEAVDSLGIDVAPDTDLPAVGQQVCGMMTKGVVGNVNPVPAVRGVVTTLANSGMEREQAVGLMQASVAIYCPQLARFAGR
ncbi:MAG: DUF732 domain-containing protein [Actinomycetia bacterium]|nr:DUF732 domain-containing protein [Actinomycetes bacterium]MCH9761320.1 DUF732 domain-containing protein [Actinomycetes bacterium]